VSQEAQKLMKHVLFAVSSSKVSSVSMVTFAGGAIQIMSSKVLGKGRFSTTSSSSNSSSSHRASPRAAAPSRNRRSMPTF
jgi:hypothetical protein|tara:strand:- start:185 stop:424 length:240 start_codon:yes stop_codon:yes gene_type:complete